MQRIDPLGSPPGARRSAPWADILFSLMAHLAALLTLGLLAAIIGSLVVGAMPAIQEYGVSFLWLTDWNPGKNVFGGLPMIVGTLLTSVIALVIAVPVSFGIALFLTELSPGWLRRPLGVAVELLAAVPSIVYGMWGLTVLSPVLSDYVHKPLKHLFSDVPILQDLVAGPANGLNIFTAGIVLAIMIIPFIASVMRDVFAVTPAMLKESAYALGSTTWEVVSKVVLPYTKTGVVGGIMLGLGRAIGETMAVTFVIGNATKISASIFTSASSITSTLANEFGEAANMHQAALLYLGLVLFLITFVVLTLSKLMLSRLQKREGSTS